MKKNLGIILIVLFAYNLSFSQKLTISPLSRIGIGDMFLQSNVRELAMGGTSIADFNHFQVSMVNPASSASLLSQKIVFSFSTFHRTSFFDYNDSTQINNVSNLSQIMCGFRVTKWYAFNFGLSPYSGIGYTIVQHDTLTSGDYKVPIVEDYEGLGNISQLFWGNSFTFFKKLSLGVKINYNFGYLSNKANLLTEDTNYTSFTSYTEIEKRSSFHKLTFEAGLLYNDTIKKSGKNFLRYSVGATYSNSNTFKTLDTRYIWRGVTAYGNNFADTLIFDTLGFSSFTVPQKIGLGLSLTYKDKLTFSADYTTQNWTNSEIFGVKNYVNSTFLGLGMEYCANQYSSSYIKTIRLRAGFYNYDSYKLYNNLQIKTQAITFGMGLPFKYILVDWGLQMGRTGNFTNGLNEKFIQFNFGISLVDIWFTKRLYN